MKRSEKLMLLVLVLLVCVSVVWPAPVKHAMIGGIEKINKAAETVAIKTADGAVQTVKWTGKTTVHGLKEGAKAVDLVGREGSHLVVHYTVKGAEKTAISFEYIGRETPKVLEGIIKVSGRETRKVAVITGDGAEEVFDLSERAVVDTGKGIASAAEYTAKETADGAKVAVHFTEDGGRRVAHFIKRL